MPLPLRTKITAGFTVALIILGIIAAFSYYSVISLLGNVDDEQRTHEIVTSLNAVIASLNAAEGAQRGYIITADQVHLGRYRQSITQARAEINQLKELTSGENTHGPVLRLEELAERRIGEFEHRRQLRDEAGLDAVASEIRADVDDPVLYAQARSIEAVVRRRLAGQQTSVRSLAGTTLGVIALGSLLAILLVSLAGVIIYREVTHRSRAYQELTDREGQLNDFLENAAELIQAVDPHGRLVYVNRAWQQTMGYTQEEARSLQFAEIVEPSERTAVSALLERVQRGRTQESLETVLVTRSGNKIIVDGTISARVDDGKLVRTRGIFRDVTEERAVERLKDEFVSVVSHELRTPLTSIRGALGLIASGRLGELNEKGQRMVHIAVNDSERLVRLINDILDIERMEAGRVELQKDLHDVADLVQRAADGVAPIADKAGVQLSTELPEASVWCDSDRILQALTNLLGNAIKFSPPGGHIWLTAESTQNEIVFKVRDQGRGIPSEKLKTIFERFQQVDASDARQKGGAGLGLAIARSIVHQHGGNIWAESDGKNGSTFVISLPAYAPRIGVPAGPADAPLIVIGEDDMSTAEVLQSMLLANGFQVVLASTGRQAVDAAVQHKPAAILLDIAMPEMDGWEALRLLKADPITADIPVVIETGTEQTLERMTHPSIQHWLQKPLQERDVIAALRRAVANKEQRPALIAAKWPIR